jgi:glycosyltransferase involved in cell wall biosynthesis
MSKITIVTPSYNQGRFIEKTFISILQQNLGSDLEYIVVDALSTDNTFKVINKYMPLFKKQGIIFKLIREKDDGQADAINKGWKIAKSEILGYLNSDDYYQKNVLKKVILAFNNESTMWAYGGWNYVNINGDLYKKVLSPDYDRRKLLYYDYIGQPACFIRKGALEKIGYLDKNLHLTMDYDLWLRLSQKWSAIRIKIIIANLRCYTQTKSSSMGLDQFKSVLNLSKKYTSPISISRVIQYLYYLIASILVIFKLDIANRIERKIKIPFLDL